MSVLIFFYNVHTRFVREVNRIEYMNKTHNCSILCPTLTWFFSLIPTLIRTKRETEKKGEEYGPIYDLIIPCGLWCVCGSVLFLQGEGTEKSNLSLCLCSQLPETEDVKELRKASQIVPSSYFHLAPLLLFHSSLCQVTAVMENSRNCNFGVTCVCEWVGLCDPQALETTIVRRILCVLHFSVFHIGRDISHARWCTASSLWAVFYLYKKICFPRFFWVFTWIKSRYSSRAVYMVRTC